MVVVGAHELTSRHYQRHKPCNWVNHPGYQGDSTLGFDLAIIMLETHVTFNKLVAPACLPDPSNDYANVTVTVSGWGMAIRESTILQKVKQF